MTIIIHSTDAFSEINGTRTRIWEGKTEAGTPIHCFIALIGVEKTHDQAGFERELEETQPTACQVAFPLRMVI